MSFEFGVASGDLTATSAVIWTRSSAESAVTWELECLDDTTRSGGVTRTGTGGFVHVQLSDLRPGSRWRYRFADGSVRSPWGRFRTLPAHGPVRFAVVSCAKYNSGFFNAYDAVAMRDDLDFVLHLGDYIYEAGQVPRGHQTPGADIGRPFDPVHDCVTQADYSRRYAQYRRDPALQRLHEAHGLIFTLDDHEIADNAWSGGAGEHFAYDGPWERRLRSALTAWEQWQPTARAPSRGGAVWQSLPLGGAATLFLCDSRLARTDPSGPDGPDKSVLGGGQVVALQDIAQRGSTPWLIVGMPSKLLSLEPARGDHDVDLVLRTLKLTDQDGAPFPDRWDAYSHERDRILALMEDSPSSPVLLCGDVHFAAFSQTLSGRVAECVTASVTSPNFDDKMGWPQGATSRTYEAKLIDRVPELQWCDLDRHGFLIVEVEEERLTCEWWGVSTVVEQSTESELLARRELDRNAAQMRRSPGRATHSL